MRESPCWLMVWVIRVWASMDSVWDQEKLEARKMLENAAESHTSGARFVGRFFTGGTPFADDNLKTLYALSLFSAIPFHALYLIVLM